MKRLIVSYILILKFFNCCDSKSSERNGLDAASFYNTNLLSDIADIFNELSNNINSPIDFLAKSENESENNMENLLSEYQSYLDKAQKQRDYVEIGNNKNIVPFLRHENHPTYFRRDNFYDLSNPSSIKSIKRKYDTIDFLIPLNMKAKQLGNKRLYQNKFPNNKLVNVDNMLYNNKETTLKKVNLLPNVYKDFRRENVKTSCFCKSDQTLCKCFDNKVTENPTSLNLLKRAEYDSDTLLNDSIDNVVNIKIKVDVQLPKTRNGLKMYYKNLNGDKRLERNFRDSKEDRSVWNLPLSNFNFPVPLYLFEFKNTVSINKPDESHHGTIHKKKKSKGPNINSKKYKKNIISYNDIKFTSLLPRSFNDNYTAYSDKGKIRNINKNANIDVNKTDTIKNNVSVIVTNNTNQFTRRNNINLEESIYFLVNASNNTIITQDDYNKIGYLFKEDDVKIIPHNISTERIITLEYQKPVNSIIVNKNITLENNITKVKFSPKKMEKNVVDDSDLLYWPNKIDNKSTVISKNINARILEREYNKGKLNLSMEAIRHNNTREQAIFSKINWDDVDTAIPTFISLVGKYITGALTFCSPTTCHSMRCAEKTCVHRVCLPEQRSNQRGHCVGSTTDSVASMESIIDLPSNVAFEIVDILQDKMLGKIFGKATLCIDTKCISFISIKKNFIKSKCILKELNEVGHCPNMKNVKTT